VDVGVTPGRSVPNSAKQGATGVYQRQRNNEEHNQNDARIRNSEGRSEKEPSLRKVASFLLADCSKGFNNSDPKWLEACLDAAKAPPDILNVVDALSLNEPILSLDGI